MQIFIYFIAYHSCIYFSLGCVLLFFYEWSFYIGDGFL